MRIYCYRVVRVLDTEKNKPQGHKSEFKDYLVFSSLSTKPKPHIWGIYSTYVLTTHSDVAVLPRSFGIHGVAPGTETIIRVSTVVVL